MVQVKKTTNGLSSEFIIHPGETLKEILIDRNINQNTLAIATGVSAKHISKILSGQSDISVSYAKKLEYALGIEAQFWINLQSNYDREVFEYEEANEISQDEIDILKIINQAIDELNYYGFLEKNMPNHQCVLKLRSLLAVSNLCDIPKLTNTGAYRIAANVNPYVLYSWQKVCELKNFAYETENTLDIQKLKDSIPEIKKCMFMDPNEMREKLRKIFSKCGIVFDIVKNYKGAPVQGYVKHLSSNRLLLCMTIRGQYMDIFWFSLFHEIGHIINGDTKNTFIDYEDVDGQIESKADTFARNTLINIDDYLLFISGDYGNIESIEFFAKKQKIDRSIIIGRLLKEDKIDYKYFNKYRKKYEWCE